MLEGGMTKEQWKERLETISRWMDGETAQVLQKDGSCSDIAPFTGIIFPIMIDSRSTIRIKPKPRDWWLVVSPGGTVRVCYDPISAANMANLEIYRDWKVVHVREVEE